MVRTAPVAIQRLPKTGTRIRNSGFAQAAGGTPIKWPEKNASPCASRVTGGVSRGVAVAVPALHTNVATTSGKPDGRVPEKSPPFSTSPSTLKVTAPLERFTRADPPRVVQGRVPA